MGNNENDLSDNKLCWVEIRWRYDWISHRVDDKWNKYSRIAKLNMEHNELCKHWKIYTVERIWDYDFKILSERDDV